MPRNILKHKPIAEAIGPGELAIDTDARQVKVNTLRGDVYLPLDFVALELRDENASSEVYVFRDTGVAEIVPFDAGGGGQASDAQPWRVPGLTPETFSTLVLNGVKATPFEVAEPIQITRLSVRTTQGTADLTMAIERENGEELFVNQQQAAVVGEHFEIVSIVLDPGRYIARLTTSAALTVRTVNGHAPWHRGLLVHPILMEVNV